jgi:tetratricopeptide (TPR) repeat protein
MRFLPTILVIVLLALAAGSFAQHGDKEKKKKKKGGDKTQATKLDKAAQQKLERLFMEAEKAKVTEDWDAAIKNYNEVLAIEPANANAHFQLAQIYANTRRLADAEKEAQEAVRLDEGNKWYLEMLSGIYMNQGKAKEATDVFKTLITRFPNNPDYYLNLGFLQTRVGQFDAAVKTYEQFEKNFGIDENVVLEKKNLYLRLNKFDEAVREVQRLYDEFGETDYLLMVAEMYRVNRMKDKATELYKKILEKEPDNAQALLAMADLGAQAGNGQQTLESVKKVFANPNVDVDTKIKILFPYLQYWDIQKEKKQDAFELAAILTATHPEDAKGYSIKGDLYFLDDQLDTALASYLQSLKYSKEVFTVWQQVMAIYNQKRDWANLQQVSTEAMELFPNQAVIYLFKGGAEVQLKDYEKALKSFGKGEKMSVENAKLRAQFLANMGDAYHSLSRHAESDSAYDRSLKLDSENSYVLNNYSYYLSLRKQNLEKAKQMSAYANKLDPDNNSFLDTYAWILFQLNDFTGAKEWQEKAMKAGGDKSGTILEHYGDILFKLGNTQEAIKYWKQAKELGTDSGTIDKKIAEGKYVE